MDPSYVSMLSSKLKLDRDKGLDGVREILRDRGSDAVSRLEGDVKELLLAGGEGWERLHGALAACALMVEAGICSDHFYKTAQETLPSILDHEEPRVRLSAG